VSEDVEYDLEDVRELRNLIKEKLDEKEELEAELEETDEEDDTEDLELEIGELDDEVNELNDVLCDQIEHIRIQVDEIVESMT
jgi:hypothetical protein